MSNLNLSFDSLPVYAQAAENVDGSGKKVNYYDSVTGERVRAYYDANLQYNVIEYILNHLNLRLVYTEGTPDRVDIKTGDQNV